MSVSWAGDVGVAVVWVGWGGWECNRGNGRLPGHKPLKDTCGQKGDSQQVMHWRLDKKEHFYKTVRNLYYC